MSTDDQLKHAEDVIAAFDAGDYDEQLGIPPEQTALVRKARGTEPLTMADVSALAKLNMHDLIDAAHLAGRIAALNESEIA